MFSEVSFSNAPTALNNKETFYFSSKRGKITKVAAKNKEAAIQLYKYEIFSTLYYPLYCWMPRKYCDNKHCDVAPILGPGCRIETEINYFISKGYGHKNSVENFIDIYSALLREFPNCDILKRITIMYNETPTVEDSDFEGIVEGEDGTKKYFMPSTIVLHWPKANIRFKTDYTDMKLTKDWFLEFLRAVTKKYYLNVCYYLLALNIHYLTQEQIDKMEGSLEPTIEAPSVTETLEVPVHHPKSGWKFRLRNRKQSYEVLEWSNLATSINP